MLDERHHIRIGLNLAHFEQSLETVALSELLSSRSSHSINSFLVFETVLVFDVVIIT